jgi:hypothetical protein
MSSFDIAKQWQLSKKTIVKTIKNETLKVKEADGVSTLLISYIYTLVNKLKKNYK